MSEFPAPFAHFFHSVISATAAKLQQILVVYNAVFTEFHTADCTVDFLFWLNIIPFLQEKNNTMETPECGFADAIHSA